MPWFKVDDKLHSHAKAIKAGEAMALWVVAGSWSSDQLTDGFIPSYIVNRLMPGGDKMADALVDAGLWFTDEVGGDDGWRFNGWEERNPVKQDVEADREAARERMRRVRAKKQDRSGNVRANTERTSPYPDPVPSPVPEPTTEEPSSSGLSADEETPPTRSVAAVEPRNVTPSEEFADRPDVIRATKAVVQLIADNGHPLPNRGTKAHRDWYVEMDRLLRLGPPGQTTTGPPDADEVIRVATWACNNNFWRSNIRSIPKFREKWSQLALKSRDGPPSGRGNSTEIADAYDRMADHLERLEAS